MNSTYAWNKMMFFFLIVASVLGITAGILMNENYKIEDSEKYKIEQHIWGVIISMHVFLIFFLMTSIPTIYDTFNYINPATSIILILLLVSFVSIMIARFSSEQIKNIEILEKIEYIILGAYIFSLFFANEMLLDKI